MGLSSAAAGDGAQLCVFDLRRGQQEGQELDKILFFHPADCPILLQLSVIGLCEGIVTFARIFSPEDDCEVIESEKHSHVFYQAEPDIWMVLIAEKTKDTESIWRCEALQGILKEVHSLFAMFHGPIRTLLDRQPSAELARGHLRMFLTDYLSDFIVGKKLQLPTFRDCLKERGTVQMLTVSRDVALEVQSLTTVLGSCLGNVTCQSLVLFEDLLVSTTLPPDDTLNLYTYAVLRLTPRALSSNTSSWSYLRKGTSVSAVPTSSSSNGAAAGERPLLREKLSKGKDGFIAADFAATEVRGAVPLTPILWFQQAEERMYLCIYQHRSITILLLIPASSVINGEDGIAHVKKHLLENASQETINVEQKLSRGWGGENAYHVSGYRYLLVDPDRRVSVLNCLVLLVIVLLIRQIITASLVHCSISFSLGLILYDDWADCPDTRRSTSGYGVFLGDNLVSWSAKRQPIVPRSNAEAEYRAVANAVAETSWLRQLLLELRCLPSRATLVYCDNVSAVYLSTKPVQHQRTKYIEIDLHFVRERVSAGTVCVLHVPTSS